MLTTQRLLAVGGVVIAAAALSFCSGSSSTTDMSNPSTDLAVSRDFAMPPPDLASADPTVTGTLAGSVLNSGGLIAITGTGFQSPVTVTVGGQPCTNAIVTSPTQITCIAPAFSKTCGVKKDISVVNGDMRTATLANGISYRGTLSFGAATNLAAPGSTRLFTTADVNKDKFVDLIGTTSNGFVSIYLSNGDGSFKPASNSNTGDNNYGVAAGDLDKDGNIDLAYISVNTSNLGVLLGNGDGTFKAVTNYNMTSGGFHVVLADIDNDGDLDAVTTGSNNVYLRLNDGTGKFPGANPDGTFTMGSNPRGLAVGDLNGDKNLDIVTSNQSSANISVRLGDGKGGFGSAATSYAVGSSPLFVQLFDLDGDKNLDAITANASGTMNVRFGDGKGSFGGANPDIVASPIGGGSPVVVRIADMDGDGLPDIVTTNTVPETLTVYRNNGNRTVTVQPSISTGVLPDGLAIFDANGDGLVDIVNASVGNSRMEVRLGLCN